MSYKHLYIFDPNKEGIQFSVCSYSAHHALDLVKDYIKKKSKEDEEYKQMYKEWKNAGEFNLPGKYCIREYWEGDVVESIIK